MTMIKKIVEKVVDDIWLCDKNNLMCMGIFKKYIVTLNRNNILINR